MRQANIFYKEHLAGILSENDALFYSPLILYVTLVLYSR